MNRRVSLVARAMLALGGAIGFYVLAIGIACGFFWVATRGSLIPGVSLLWAVLGMVILWAIVPRIDRFEPPGPRVTPMEEPALFELVAAVAAATRQRMPDDLYLVNAVTASVTQRGGILGLGSRRVLIIGLPLMQLLTIEELKAVVAHEFGHFYAGDVALGPLVYRTRAAMQRTLASFSDHWMEMLFTWYTDWFTRVTAAVSRHQEHIADLLAARIVGGVALGDALRKMHAGGPAYSEYVFKVLAPVIYAGYLPRVMEGFARFMRAEPVIERMRRQVAEGEADDSLDPNGTHPCLKERLAALSDYVEESPRDGRPAIDLLVKLPEWEQRAVAASFAAPLRDVQPIEWDDFMERMILPSWRRVVLECAPVLKNLTVTSFPHTRRELVALGRLFRSSEGDAPPAADATFAKHLLGSAIALTLLNSGWTAAAVIGDDPVFRRDTDELKVFSALDQMDAATLSVKEWRRRCEELGIADLPLSTATMAAAAHYSTDPVHRDIARSR